MLSFETLPHLDFKVDTLDAKLPQITLYSLEQPVLAIFRISDLQADN